MMFVEGLFVREMNVVDELISHLVELLPRQDPVVCQRLAPNASAPLQALTDPFGEGVDLEWALDSTRVKLSQILGQDDLSELTKLNDHLFLALFEVLLDLGFLDVGPYVRRALLVLLKHIVEHTGQASASLHTKNLLDFSFGELMASDFPLL